jgi:hypothetical protein
VSQYSALSSSAVPVDSLLAGSISSLAIYEALIQANVPPAAARRVAECLEKDMTSALATKQDLAHMQQLLNAQFLALETRIIFKLGAFMVVLIGLAGTLLKALG